MTKPKSQLAKAGGTKIAGTPSKPGQGAPAKPSAKPPLGGVKPGGAGDSKAGGSSKRKAPDDKGEALMKKRGTFSKDLRLMMYGFGDSEHPLQETVDTLEDILVEYIETFVHTAMEHSSKTGKVQKEDLLFQVRKDPRKFNRAMELLLMDERIKEARRCIEDMESTEAVAGMSGQDPGAV